MSGQLVGAVLAAGNYANPGPTAPSAAVSQAFGTLVGDLKWISGAAAIIGVIVLVIMGVVSHREGRTIPDTFGGFVKIVFLLILVSSAVTMVTTFLV